MIVKMFASVRVPSAVSMLRTAVTAFAFSSAAEALSLNELVHNSVSLSQTKATHTQDDIDYVLA